MRSMIDHDRARPTSILIPRYPTWFAVIIAIALFCILFIGLVAIGVFFVVNVMTGVGVLKTPWAEISIVLGAVPAVAVAIVVSWMAFVHLKWKRIRLQKNACYKCRYDLTGNISGVCPECGTAVPQFKKRLSEE